LAREIDAVPPEFMPRAVDSTIPMITDISNGGRNNELTKLIGCIRNTTSSTRAVEILKIANSHLVEPLPENELTMLNLKTDKSSGLKTDNYLEKVNINKYLVPYDFVLDELLPALPMTMFQKKLYFFNGKYWTCDDTILERKILSLNHLLTITNCKEILHKAKYLPEEKYYPVVFNHGYIGVKNGLIDTSGNLIDFT
jgi:hypothetical protein